jgi:uncharacterized OsmC-like protein
MTSTTDVDAQLFDTIPVTVSAGPSKTKMVTLPSEPQPVAMGMRDSVAEHYGIDMSSVEAHATSIDYLVGAAVGCMTGTLAGRLAALGQPTDPDHLRAQGEGRMVKDNGVLRVDSIHVVYHLKADPGIEPRELERAHARHERYCPVARSIGAAVTLTSELRLE